jgi:hypothetical protein
MFRPMLRSLTCAFLTLGLGLALAGCGEDSPLAGACGDGFDAESGEVGDFGAGEAALKVEAFLEASAAVYGAAVDVEADVLTACTAMAGDLGIAAAELEPAGAELAVTAACGRLAVEIDDIIATLPQGVALGIAVTPPLCEIDLELAASCAAECDASITGSAEVECTGELHGSCSGTCSGACSVEAAVDCEGECSAECSGSCSGSCYGACDGECSATDESGACVGTCAGTCTGTCTATCTGGCSGTCTAEVDATCEGECHGSCDVAWEAECNGEAQVEAEADCQAACETQANATATCTEPELTIVLVAPVDAADLVRVTALVATLEANYGLILQAQARLEYALAPSLEAFVDSLEGAADAVVEAGAQAVSCMALALDAAADAALRVDASVEVTIEVSASVSASGTTPP